MASALPWSRSQSPLAPLWAPYYSLQLGQTPTNAPCAKCWPWWVLPLAALGAGAVAYWAKDPKKKGRRR